MNITTAADEPLLEVDDLQVHLRSGDRVVRAVDGVDFHVAPGECVGIVGESGSGKSMLARALTRLMPNVQLDSMTGTARFAGQDVLSLSDDEMRQLRRTNSFSMVFQDPLSHLNPTKRLGRQVAEALPRVMSSAQRKTRVVELLDSVGIPSAATVALRYPHEISGGMRQRVLIALALASEPRLLIADEPTTALDVTVQVQVLNTLERLHRERQMALVLITHDLALIAELCDRVYVMYAGQIVESNDVVSTFSGPQHPYTRGLVASVPGKNSVSDDKQKLTGSVPDMANLESGCRFRPRCSHAFDKCSEMPPIIHSKGAEVRCWLAESSGPSRVVEGAPS